VFCATVFMFSRIRCCSAVTSVIFGTRSVEQLDANLGAATLKLPAELMKRLDEASSFELGYPYDFMGRLMGSW